MAPSGVKNRDLYYSTLYGKSRVLRESSAISLSSFMRVIRVPKSVFNISGIICISADSRMVRSSFQRRTARFGTREFLLRPCRIVSTHNNLCLQAHCGLVRLPDTKLAYLLLVSTTRSCIGTASNQQRVWLALGSIRIPQLPECRKIAHH